MADPLTWMALATAVSTGTAVIGGIQQSQQAKAEADVASANAEIAASQANQAEELQRRRNRQALAAQRAAIAESGTGFGGSNLPLQRDSAIAAELEALNVRYEGVLRGQGYRTEAALARKRSRGALIGGGLSAAGQLLGGGAQIAYLRDLKRV